MGYYTHYKLGVHSEIPEEVGHWKAISDMAGYYSCFGESIKWYEHDKHMREYSKLYPNHLFVLEGTGEESGDIWKTYYKNGKAQTTKAKITFDEFDEEKLK